MTAAVLLALGVAAGGDLRLLAMAGGAVWAPLPTAVAVAVMTVLARRAEFRAAHRLDMSFLETVVAELRAGGSPRRALRAACRVLPNGQAMARRLDAGEPLRTSLDGLETRLPSVGALVVDAVTVANGAGRMLPVVEELIVHAASEADVAAELRAATAQVRASLWILVGCPVAYLAWSFGTGRLGPLLALPGGSMVAMVGAGLMAVGGSTMVMLARSGR